MYHFTSTLLTYNIEATDGEMGKLKGLYIDDKSWKIRYCIVDTRKWLPERKVLLPPGAFIRINEQNETLEVEYDKSTIKDSPPIPENTDLTRDEEDQLMNYFGWTPYWQNDALVSGERPLGMYLRRKDQELPGDVTDRSNQDEELILEHKDNNLRSQEEILNARVHGTDGKLGRLVDFIFDEDWNVEFIVLTSSNLTIKDYYYFPVGRIQSVDWFEGDVYLNETVEGFEVRKAFPDKEDILMTLQ